MFDSAVKSQFIYALYVVHNPPIDLKYVGHPKDVLVLDKELYDDVNVELCKILVKKAKVDIVLKKVNSGEWPTLEGATRKGKAKGTPSSSSTAPAQSGMLCVIS